MVTYGGLNVPDLVDVSTFDADGRRRIRCAMTSRHRLITESSLYTPGKGSNAAGCRAYQCDMCILCERNLETYVKWEKENVEL